MKKRIINLLLLLFLIGQTAYANEPDSGYIFAYNLEQNDGRGGLRFAWSIDQENWHAINPEFSYVNSDYGRWGSEKRMYNPFLFLDDKGNWQLIWSLNNRDAVFAHASSSDLIYWGRQTYPVAKEDNNCLLPQITSNGTGTYTLVWLSDKDGIKKAFSATTTDFKNYTPTTEVPLASHKNLRHKLTILGKEENGTIHKVDWKAIDRLIHKQELASSLQTLWSETAKDDHLRFASLKPVDFKLNANPTSGKKISDMLIGIFFEDISYAADGGLYAELIQNRGFEYDPSDKEGHDKLWDNKRAWLLKGNAEFSIEETNPIHKNNPHYAVLNVYEIGAGLVNEGFDGIPLKKGEKYDLSLFARMEEGKPGKLLIRLIGENGQVYGEVSTKNIGREWKKYEVIITAKETVDKVFLEIIPQMTGKSHLDMVSLFPQNTFKGRKNGLRNDLAQVIADVNPRFIRFPGGCVAHGDGLHNMYRWKNTIGKLEERIPQRNIWAYHQTAGLGYYEYFQYCEDIGAAPLPVLAAGVPCQNSATGGAGQQGGIPMCEMDDYVQEVLDLIEWANGDKSTYWGKKRAEAGHPKPFNLKYVGIGNEDLITDIFEERFTMIFNAVKEKYPEIIVIGTVGPFWEGTDYVEGWDIATKLGVPMVDEHYYQPPAWYIYNQDYYDRYDRNKSNVYLGEYAAHLPDRSNNIETALSEALYLTTLERNGDIVSMTSYAPLLAKKGNTNWNPDLLYFDNTSIDLTPGYYVQQLYGIYSGDEYIPAHVDTSAKNRKVRSRIATSIVRNSSTGDVIVKLVNMLPAAVNTTLDLSDLDIRQGKATKIVLTGKPDSKTATPSTGDIDISAETAYTMPAYSFTVIHISKK